MKDCSGRRTSVSSIHWSSSQPLDVGVHVKGHFYKTPPIFKSLFISVHAQIF